jgi:hypothetical protein
MTITLSPGTLLNIKQLILEREKPPPPHPMPLPRWMCPICEEVYIRLFEAQRCCCSNETKQSEYSHKKCPVCDTEYRDPYQASDCCLWKDIEQSARHEIAARVENGQTWAEALGIN